MFTRVNIRPASTDAEIKRRKNVVGIFPNDTSITMLLEQSAEWSLDRRCMQLEGLLEGLHSLSDTVPARLPALAR